jgi:hypothetical protein
LQYASGIDLEFFEQRRLILILVRDGMIFEKVLSRSRIPIKGWREDARLVVRGVGRVEIRRRVREVIVLRGVKILKLCKNDEIKLATSIFALF